MTPLWNPTRVPRSWPLATSQSFTFPFSQPLKGGSSLRIPPPVARLLLSRLKLTDVTSLRCPRRVTRSLWLDTSHNLTSPDCHLVRNFTPLLDASSLPSGLNARPVTVATWPVRTACFFSRSHVPQAHRLVVAPRCQDRRVGVEGYTANRIGVSTKIGTLSAGGRVPELQFALL